MVVESLIQDTGAGPYTLTGAISAFTSFLSVLPLQQLIRLAWIVGGYILLRPYLELGFRKLFATQAEHDSDTVAAVTKAPPLKGNPVAEVTKGIETSSARIAVGRTAWGTTARNRQTRILQAWEKEQARLAEERDLDGIDPELLED
jgi:hypothetical protein